MTPGYMNCLVLISGNHAFSYSRYYCACGMASWLVLTPTGVVGLLACDMHYKMKDKNTIIFIQGTGAYKYVIS